MNARLHPSFLVATVLTLVFLVAARGEEATTAIKFSDPAKPGTVKIVLARGNLRIAGTDSVEVSVKSTARAASRAPRKDGLRVLTSSSSFSLSEKDNVVTLDAASDGWSGAGSDFNLTVPRSSAVVVQSSWGGDVECGGVAGDIEIHSMNGQIQLDEVTGGIVVDTMNGKISASINELHENKPLSFTSMNGEVVLRLPAEARASVRLRTQNGAVLTDFPESALVTKTENAPRTVSRHTGKTIVINGHTVFGPEAHDAIREAARVGVQVARETAQAIREGVEAARLHAEVVREQAEAAREQTEAVREQAEGAAGRSPARAPRAPRVPSDPTSPVPPVPPVPVIPTISGGKLVTGTLNGGGPEISVATMNGDVVLRQLGRK